ncbi:Dienelactone hydrolase [Corchorus capsularis]|uniref:Dienelactone hydrolase n=1 Tax=Corchorus capsularis TaxID=210143 RepID=A0A1R3GAP2_COCAP|nr:Dienelactone hydrolase [Corchorus capsularis]
MAALPFLKSELCLRSVISQSLFILQDKGAEDAKQILAALKSRGLCTIGAAGFCWGEVKVPIPILGPENDHVSPPEQLNQIGEILSTKTESSLIAMCRLCKLTILAFIVCVCMRTRADNLVNCNPAAERYEAPNLRKLADKAAAAGFYAVVPDFLYGEPYAPENSDRPIGVWIKDHGPDKGFEDAKLVIEALKSKGISAIGAVGFCWVAKVVVGLAKEAVIQAAVMCHPSFVTVDDIKAVKVPISILGAEIDHLSPPELVKQFDEILSAKPEVDHFVKIFPKCTHGWTVRYNAEDPTAASCADEAHKDLLEWFAKYVK